MAVDRRTTARRPRRGKASVVRAQAPAGSGVVLIGTSVVTRLHAKGLQPQLGRAILLAAAPNHDGSTSTDGSVGGTVPATLSLTLGAPATFGAFTPGVAREYNASTTANVISTAGDATLTVADPSSTHTGSLVNGSFALAQPLQAGSGATLAAVGARPPTLKTWSAPTSNESVTIDSGSRSAPTRRCARAPTARR